MKKLLLAVSLAFAATGVQATTIVGNQLSLDYVEPGFSFVGTNDVLNFDILGGGAPVGGYNGQLSALSDVEFRVTFLGKSASNTNFYMSNGSVVTGSGTDDIAVGTTMYFDVTAGLIDFGFTGTGGLTAANLDASHIGNIAYIATYAGSGDPYFDPTTGLPFDFIIGFNDGGSPDDDFDDYVIGVTAAIPVPAALPLMASALGMFGIARRRKAHSA
jgi:hypothetical protein